ncbi:MAG TPA: pitrilysin family protein [Bacteroidales bacterium]|nr:pitrilysin family protein [Bacteroidales bacterium]
MAVERHTLSNGIRIIYRPVDSPVSHCAVFIPAGTRNENPDEHGIAHFIEHTIFKGTKKRSLLQVLNRLENVGADLNAFTTKEETCIHASFLDQYFGRSLELLHDICFHSVFPGGEIEKEKQVVADEIRSYQDTPSEQIYDDFEDLLFDGHPLGRNILGTLESVKSFTRDRIRQFIRGNWIPEKTVICLSGRTGFPILVSAAEGYFGKEAPAGHGNGSRKKLDYTPSTRFVEKPINQVHCILGSPAYPVSDKNRLPMVLLNNLLGGPVMNSRLSLALREKNGLTYHIDSSYTPYTDAGIFAIYFGTEPGLYDKALALIHKELKKMREVKLSPVKLHTVRKQLKGQLAIAFDSNLSVILSMGKSILRQDRFDLPEELLKKIDRITAEQVLEVANEILDPGRFSLLAYFPNKKL